LLRRGRIGNLLILRLTPRKLRRITRTAWSNESRSGSCLGRPGEQLRASGRGWRSEPSSVRRTPDAPDREFCCVGVPSDRSSSLGLKQHDPRSAEVGFEFIERRFYLPALVIERCQLASRGLAGIQNRGRQPVDRFRSLQPCAGLRACLRSLDLISRSHQGGY
jgi:hypothetical protein